MAAPLLSIVTIHWRDPEGLRATLDSVCGRDWSVPFEWVVVDGGTDTNDADTAQLFDQVRQLATRFLSEPDDGIYDAMNKGAQAASGDWVLFLNAGDCLHPQFDPARLSGYSAENAPDMLWGVSCDRLPGGEAYPVRTRAPGWLRYGPATAHQAILFRRAALGQPAYDTRYQIAADYDLICRLYTAGGGVERLSMPICIYELGGRSAADTGATLREEARVRAERFGMPAWLSGLIMHVKHGAWKATQRFPGLRKSLRGKV